MAAGAAVSARAAAAAAGPLITRKIPSSGEAIPVIGLGTSGPFEVGKSAGERAPLKEVLDAFFAAGARLVDTSPMYSTAEGVLGDLMSASMQKEVFLATKVWTRGDREGVEQMRHSAQVLKHPKLDLIQVHNLLDLDTHLKTLRAMKDEGRVRYIGITHYTVGSQPELMRIIQREKLDFVQLNYSAGTRNAEEQAAAARRGSRRCGSGEPPVRGRQDVRGGERAAACPSWAAEIDCDELGADLPQVRARESGRHVRDSGDRKGEALAGQSRRRPRAPAGCETANADRAGAGRVVVARLADSRACAARA